MAGITGHMAGNREISFRNTKQKEAIRKAFLEADRPLSVEETLALAKRGARKISLATVYRNINALVADRWLVPVEMSALAITR
jgi:Fur family ferric uptake transcriptional regulator